MTDGPRWSLATASWCASASPTAPSSRRRRTPSRSSPPAATRCRSRAPAEPSAFGFVCGEPRGSTVVFRWDGEESRLVELRRFDSPREVLASGSGGLAVRGACGDPVVGRRREPGDSAEPGDHPGSGEPSLRDRQDWCLMTPDGDWSEMHFSGAGVDRARIVVLSSRRVALVRPPEGGDLSSARLTVTDGVTDAVRATHLPLRLEPVAPEVARALRWGVWMEQLRGAPARRPGRLGRRGRVDPGRRDHARRPAPAWASTSATPERPWLRAGGRSAGPRRAAASRRPTAG